MDTSENDGGQQPADRERTAEEMAILHAAMMEELGIARRDALPLEDKKAGMPLAVLPVPSKRLRADNPVAGWHTFSQDLDDVNPAEGELDNIADGQLYRLRRGGGPVSRGRGGQFNGSPGRGRGGASTRGGHSSMSGRGGYNPTHIGHHRIDNSDVSFPGQQQAHFNDGRRSRRANQFIDSGIARLHREAEISKARKTTGFSTKVPPTAPKASRSSHSVGAQPPRRPAASKYSLASPQAFLAAAKVNVNPTPAATHTTASASVDPPKSVSVISTISKVAISASQNNGGLQASRWASPPATAAVSVVPSEASVPPNIPAIAVSTSVATSAPVSVKAAENRVPVEERPVKISKNRSLPRAGTAMLVKFDEHSHLNIVLLIENEKVVDDELTQAATLSLDGSHVIYRPDPKFNRPITWTIRFQLPVPAQKFVNTHHFRLAKMRGLGNNAASQSNEQPIPSSTASAPSRPASVPSVSTTSLPPVQQISYPMPRISSGTYADLASLDGHDLLISFDEDVREASKDEESQAPAISAMADLLSLVDEPIIASTLHVLNTTYGGSFIDHVSQIAKGTGLEHDADFMERSKKVFSGGLSSSRFAKPMLTITEELVADFLKKSETFSLLPQGFIETYIKDTSKKVLDKAQNPNKDEDVLAKVETFEPSDIVKAEEVIEDNGLTDAIADVESAGHHLSSSTKKRIIYSADELQSLRDKATVIDGELIEKKYLPSFKRSISSSNIIQTTSQGVRIVAGKSSEPQYRDSVRATAPKLSVSQWKTGFATANSKDNASQLMNRSESGGENIAKQENVLASGAPNNVTIKSTDNTIDHIQSVHVTPASLPTETKLPIQSESLKCPGSEVVKTEEKDDDSPIVLPTNHGLSTSRWATKAVVNQAAVLRATSGFQPPLRETALAGGSVSNKSATGNDVNPNGSARTQQHDAALWNTLLMSKKRPAAKQAISAKSLETTHSASTPEIEEVRNKESQDNGSVVKIEDNRDEQSLDVANGESQHMRSGTIAPAQQPSYIPGQYAPQTQDLSLNSSQMSGNRPASSMGQPQTPSMNPSVSHTHMPQPKPVFTEDAFAGFRKLADQRATTQNEKVAPTSTEDALAGFRRLANLGATTQKEKAAKQWVTSQVTKGTGATLGEAKAAALSGTTLQPTSTKHHQTDSDGELAMRLQGLPTSTKHYQTDSDGELAKRLQGLDLKTEKICPAATPVPTIAREASPSIDEIIEKCCSKGLATSRWAGNDVPEFKPQARQPMPKAIHAPSNSFNKSSLTFQQGSSVFNNTPSPVFNQPGHQHGYSGAWPPQFPPGTQNLPAAQSSSPETQTLFFTDPMTGQLVEFHGTVKPVASPSQYVQGFPSPGPLSFPPRPSMLLQAPFSDSEGEEALKPTASVFTPARPRTAAGRPALSPVKRENNVAAQESLQARLNMSLAGRRY